ncbi:Asp23/Gls24 family envelope stress response protein [Pseudonocardia nigra]|uniref:Asp23/Gls24 family envelope stress response protein n=1 Tax=Pseudonocardia nigra TaxID=1921578 RepID=UPI001C5EB96A|nr:Asp23/Gls24 family envelope stress response protein [Pseudonocardia nigra]
MNSADLLPPPAEPWSTPPGRPSPDRPDPAEDRGELSIDDGVVEQIAAAALGEVEHIGGAARRVLGVPLGADDPDQLARVTATVTGSVVALDVRCSVAYPAPVARVTDQARAHLIARIEELTGLTAAQIDITVTALPARSGRDHRRVPADGLGRLVALGVLGEP